MIEKQYETPCGTIHYWTNEVMDEAQTTLVFLPGLTADHRLFDPQIEYFQDKYNVFVWGAPAHAASWPFTFTFTLMDKAKWLDEILQKEGIHKPIVVGQSMGGYVGQAYMEQFPGKLKGFVSIDSAPLQKQYVTDMEIWMLNHVEPVYRYYPWKPLLKAGSNGCAETSYHERKWENVEKASAINWRCRRKIMRRSERESKRWRRAESNKRILSDYGEDFCGLMLFRF